MNHSAPVVLMGVVGSHATACVNSDFDDDGDSAGGGDGEETATAGRHECDSCGCVYRDLASLRRHRRRAHTERLVRPECDRVFQGDEAIA